MHELTAFSPKTRSEKLKWKMQNEEFCIVVPAEYYDARYIYMRVTVLSVHHASMPYLGDTVHEIEWAATSRKAFPVPARGNKIFHMDLPHRALNRVHPAYPRKGI